MKLTLPDNSIVFFDERTFKFSKTDMVEKSEIDFSNLYDFQKLVQFIEHPDQKFSKCFRRIGENTRYSSILSHYSFYFTFLEHFYVLKYTSAYGGMFSSYGYTVEILDGIIEQRTGYGWGSPSWKALEGCEVLRAVCMLFGIQQPKSIKGEISRRDLSDILIDLSKYEIKSSGFSQWDCPWRKKSET